MTIDDLPGRLRAWTLQDPDAAASEPDQLAGKGQLDAADGLPMYAPTGQVRDRRWLARAAVIVPILAITGALALGVARRSDDSSTVGTPGGSVAPATTEPFRAGPCAAPVAPARTPESQAASDAAAAEQTELIERTGFGRVRGRALDGTYICGWTRMGNLTMEDMRALPTAGTPMYDAPNGNVMGYSFQALGYVSAAEAEAPGFDPSQLRIRRYGCDPVLDRSCTPPRTWDGPDR